MKKALLLLAACLGMFVAGCSGVVDSPSERARRYKSITNLQTRMLVDDLDYVFLYDRSSRLTFWHPQVGH